MRNSCKIIINIPVGDADGEMIPVLLLIVLVLVVGIIVLSYVHESLVFLLIKLLEKAVRKENNDKDYNCIIII